MKKAIAFILAVVIVPTLLFSGCNNEISGDKIIASVKTDTEKQKNFDISYDEFMSEYRFNLQGKELDETNEANAEECKEIRQQIIDFLTSERIRLQVAEDLGIGVSALTSEEIDEIMKNSDSLLQSFSESFYGDAKAELGETAAEDEINARAAVLADDYFTNAGTTKDIVYTWQRNSYIEEKLINLIISDVAVDENELNDIIGKMQEEAKNVYENDPASYNTDEEYQTLYIPENSRRIRTILVPFSAERSEQIYNLRSSGDDDSADKLRDSSAPEIMDKANEIYEKLSAGESFFNLMQQYAAESESFMSYPEGYLLTPKSTRLGNNYAVGEGYIKEAYGLKNVGDYTELLLNDDGYMILEYSSDAVIIDEDFEMMRQDVSSELLSNAQYIRIYEKEAEWTAQYPYNIDYKILRLDEPSTISSDGMS